MVIDSYNDHRSAPFSRACWLVSATNSTRAWEPTLSCNQLHSLRNRSLDNAENDDRILVQLSKTLSKGCNTIQHRSSNPLLVCFIESVEIISHLLFREQRWVEPIQERSG